MNRLSEADRKNLIYDNTIASARFEGCEPDDTVKHDLRKYLDGKVSMIELIEQAKRKNAKMQN